MPPNKEKTHYEKYVSWMTENAYWGYLNYIIGGGLALLLIILIFGGRLGIFDYLGMQWMFNEERGVYADCSKPENRGVSYCQPKQSAVDRDWDEMSRGGGRAMPFTLHGN